MRKRPSGSVPGWVWGIGGAVVALAVAVPLLRQERADPGPPPAAPEPAAEPPLVVDRDVKPENVTPAEPTLEERRARYVDARARELAAEKYARLGLASSQVSDQELEADRAIFAARAEREWTLRQLLEATTRDLIAERPQSRTALLAGCEAAWVVERDLAQMPESDGAIYATDRARERQRQLVLRFADQAELQERVGGR